MEHPCGDWDEASTAFPAIHGTESSMWCLLLSSKQWLLMCLSLSQQWFVSPIAMSPGHFLHTAEFLVFPQFSDSRGWDGTRCICSETGLKGSCCRLPAVSHCWEKITMGVDYPVRCPWACVGRLRCFLILTPLVTCCMLVRHWVDLFVILSLNPSPVVGSAALKPGFCAWVNDLLSTTQGTPWILPLPKSPC